MDTFMEALMQKILKTMLLASIVASTTADDAHGLWLLERDGFEFTTMGDARRVDPPVDAQGCLIIGNICEIGQKLAYIGCEQNNSFRDVADKIQAAVIDFITDESLVFIASNMLHDFIHDNQPVLQLLQQGLAQHVNEAELPTMCDLMLTKAFVNYAFPHIATNPEANGLFWKDNDGHLGARIGNNSIHRDAGERLLASVIGNVSIRNPNKEVIYELNLDPDDPDLVSRMLFTTTDGNGYLRFKLPTSVLNPELFNFIHHARIKAALRIAINNALHPEVPINAEGYWAVFNEERQNPNANEIARWKIRNDYRSSLKDEVERLANEYAQLLPEIHEQDLENFQARIEGAYQELVNRKNQRLHELEQPPHHP